MGTTPVEWMNFVVHLADRGQVAGRRVGAAIISKSNELLCSVYEGELDERSWEESILLKLEGIDTSSAGSLYLTINTTTETRGFGLSRVLATLDVPEIYIGLPDPDLASYLAHDPVLVREDIRRFPDALQRRILDQNAPIYSSSPQSITLNPHYSKHRISESVQSALTAAGVPLNSDELHANRTRLALSKAITDKYGLTHLKADDIVSRALSSAFDEKYGSYDYSYDARSVNPEWPEQFENAYRTVSSAPLSDLRVLNVGVGGGHEARRLFGACEQVTFVDIAEGSIASVKRTFPQADALIANADDLKVLPSRSYDLYVSLRTFNSSFFDMASAASEARRVLRAGGGLIVSVASGFLYGEQGDSVLPGLILPGTEFIDLYRSVDVARALAAEFDSAGFAELSTSPSLTEIYLTGIAV